MRTYNYITHLRVIACLMIIMAHTVCTPVIYYSPEYSDFWLKLSVAVSEICRGGVCIFIAISGALFLQPEKEICLEKLFKKYILRILLALFIFGTLFALMEIVYNEKRFSLAQVPLAFLNMLQNKTWGHLWYLYMLVGLYLATPILKRFVNSAPQSEIIYLVALLFVFNIIFPLIEKYAGIKIGFSIPFAGSALFFYMLGYALHSKVLKIPDILSVLLILFSLLIYVLESIFKFGIDTSGVHFIGFSNTEFFKSLIPVAFFSLMINHSDSFVASKLENQFSACSFGIYIFHAVFINFIYKVLDLSPSKLNVMLIWLIVFFATAILSFGITYLLRLVQFVKKHIL